MRRRRPELLAIFVFPEFPTEETLRFENVSNRALSRRHRAKTLDGVEDSKLLNTQRVRSRSEDRRARPGGRQPQFRRAHDGGRKSLRRRRRSAGGRSDRSTTSLRPQNVGQRHISPSTAHRSAFRTVSRILVTTSGELILFAESVGGPSGTARGRQPQLRRAHGDGRKSLRPLDDVAAATKRRTTSRLIVCGTQLGTSGRFPHPSNYFR